MFQEPTLRSGLLLWLLLGLLPGMAAEASSASVDTALLRTNNSWLLVATFLVFIMHLGFATLEAGLTRAKNTVNILFKNTGTIAIGLLTYAMCGFNLMYPDSFTAGTGMEFFGFDGWGLALPENYDPLTYADGNYTYWTDFLFQAMFAATCATIVSGAVAERIKIGSFLIFSAVFVGFFYPVMGSWHWGQGWLADKGFHDFAGSTMVHAAGGAAALAGVLLLGPRIGKYVHSRVKPIMGHNMPLAAIGVFLLWFGWYGFNGGSVLSADAEQVSYVFVTTSLAAAAGVLSAISTSWIVQKKPDLTMALNGSLAGLVGVTAGADVLAVNDAILIGLISGVLVVFSVILFDRCRIDDPVGALSVHLVCGSWGTIAVGLFTEQSVWVQLTGVGAVTGAAFLSAGAIFLVLKHTIGIRVSESEEINGLDIGEHGMEAYTGFQIFNTQ